MSVSFVYRQKMDLSICVLKVGFPKYSHIHMKVEISGHVVYYYYRLLGYTYFISNIN